MLKNPASYIDHTLLRPTATANDVEQLCREALENSFFSVCVNPCWISLCVQKLISSSVKVCTVVGFPLGAQTTATKVFETQQALTLGASEIDIVMNVGMLRSFRDKDVVDELRAVVDLCQNKALVKVIVESGVLSSEELARAIDIVNVTGAEFIKTSTGFAAVGATEDAVLLMKQRGRPGLKIKASGGIKTASDFKKYINLGVSRVGASQSVSILKELGDL